MKPTTGVTPTTKQSRDQLSERHGADFHAGPEFGNKAKPSTPGPVTASNPSLPQSTDRGASGIRSQAQGQIGSTTSVPGRPAPQIHKSQDGSIITNRFSDTGKLSEKVTTQKNGGQQIKRFHSNGTLSAQIDANQYGTRHLTQFNSMGKVTREEVANKDGSNVITSHKFDRGGLTRSTETIKHNSQGGAMSKTVHVNRPVVLARKTSFNEIPLVKKYDHGRFGFVYHPDHAQRAPFLAFHHDPYWHNPAGTMHHHPFHYAWNWNQCAWYRSRAFYFPVYEIYPTPVYWVTDWMVGSYLAEGYEADSPGPDEPYAEMAVIGRYATPISSDLKEELRVQVETTIAEEELLADNGSGTPVTTDLAHALADPKHIYPVSGTLGVTLAADESQSVTVTDGDLLKLEPGQGDLLADATENTLVTMRVMTSKGEEGEARAGSLISVPLKALQDFDSEFRARIGLGLAEAAANQALFKSGAE